MRLTLILAAMALVSYTPAEAQWATPTALAQTGSGGAEPLSYYSLDANPGLAIVLNTGVGDVNGFSFGPDLGWNLFNTNGEWVENDELLSSPQLYNKTAILPQILSTPAFGLGVMQGASGGIYGFVFNNGSWRAGVVITSDPDAEFPAVALNDNVYVFPSIIPIGIAVWNQTIPNPPIYYSLYTAAPFLPEPIWTEPLIIPGSIGIYPSISCDVLGQAVAVWVNTSQNTLDAATYKLDNAPDYNIWSNITSVGTSDGGFPRLKQDANGNAYALWTDVDSNVVAAYLSQGGSWTNVTTLNPTAGNSAPSLAVDPIGNAAAVWQDEDNNIFASFLPALQGQWQPAIQIGTGSTPEVTMDTLGNASAAWSDPDENIQAATLPFNGSWSDPTQVSASGLGSTLPKVGSDGDSAVVIIWDQSSTGTLMASSATDLFPPIAPYNLQVNLKRKDNARDRYISFKPSWDTSIVNYNLYRNNSLIAQIPTQGPYIYYDRASKSRSDLYSVVSVNGKGAFSTPIEATVPQK